MPDGDARGVTVIPCKALIMLVSRTDAVETGKLKLAQEELSVGFAEAALAERAAEITGRIKAHLPFLGKVRGKLSVENVVDMVENARRRIADQGRFDDGVARLYRCVEMWHQFRLLERYSLTTKGIQWDKVPEEVREKFLA